MRLFKPDEQAISVHVIDYEGLWQRGIRVLLFDLDNTLALWREPPDEQTQVLLRRLLERGFRIAVLSNGRLSERPAVVSAFAELGIPLIWPARKPMRRGIRKALEQLSAKPNEAALIGDQLFTDVLGAKCLGIYTVLVTPLGPRENPWTKINRFLEWLVGRPPVQPQN